MTYDVRSGTILALVLALVLNLIVFFAGNTLFGPFTVEGPPGVVSALPIIIVTLITTIGAGIIFWLLQRMTSSFVWIFLWLAAILAALSLLPVYFQAIGRPSFFSLGLMHIATAMAVVYGLLYFSSCDDCEETAR